MAKGKWTKTSKSLLFKLIYRGVLFLSALAYYVVFLVLGGNYKDGNVLFGDIDTIPVFLILMTVIFGVEMLLRFFPTKHEPIGNQKMFKAHYLPGEKSERKSPLKQSPKRTLLVFGAWVALNSVFGILYFLGIFSADVLVLISLAFSVCDIICIMFFCPFQAWMMKNKCCATCRIYNWDYPMMFTPLLFLVFKPRAVLHYVLLALALAVLLIWEITYRRHPERFTEDTNARLQCRNCTEKLCRHNKLYPNKDALLRFAKTKQAEAKEKLKEKTNV
jgi:hypothetical protein